MMISACETEHSTGARERKRAPDVHPLRRAPAPRLPPRLAALAACLACILAPLSAPAAAASTVTAEEGSAPGGDGARAPAGKPPVGKADTGGVRLATHRVVYDLVLDHASQRTGIIAASGRIVMEVAGGACTGWSTRTRMVVDMTFRRRGGRLSDSRDAGWESARADLFRYTSRRYVNGVKTEDYRVVAERRGGSGPVEVTIRAPRERHTTLPPGTLFPLQATRRLVSAARAGRRTLRFLVYEGFDDGRARRVVAMIGAPVAAVPAPAAPLAGLAVWPVSLAYYRDVADSPMHGFGLPEYEISFRLYENGVVDAVRLDYGDYAMRARMVRYLPLPPAACDGAKPGEGGQAPAADGEKPPPAAPAPRDGRKGGDAR